MSVAKNVGCGCVAAAFAAVGVVVLAIVLGVCCLGGKIASNADRLLGEDLDDYGLNRPECEKPLAMKWMCGEGNEDDPRIAYIPLKGVIAETAADEGLFSDAMSDYSRALRAIRAATRDEEIRGICLRLDTPGGTVTDSDAMVDALRRFKAADSNRFVLVSMGAMCCSGGYYVAAEADYIMATPTTLTGSIGVIMAGFNAAELAKKIGVKSVIIASGENKALLDPLEPVNPEHVGILRRAVEQDYERFVEIVAGGRGLPVSQVRKIADGRVLSARDAKEAKLIDGLGYDEDVWAKAAELAEAERVRIYRYEESFSWRNLFSSSTFMKCGRAFIGGLKAEAVSPRNEYRVR